MRVWIAQPWPPWKQTAMPDGTDVANSASSSTIVADLPPSSRNVRLRVAPPLSMIRLPTAVEPVNEIRSTFGGQRQLLADQVVGGGHDVEDTGREVGLLGDEAAEAGGVPRRVRRGLEDHGVAGGQGLPEFVQRHLEREVPGHNGTDDADGLLPDLSRVGRAPAVDDLTFRSVRQGNSSMSLIG